MLISKYWAPVHTNTWSLSGILMTAAEKWWVLWSRRHLPSRVCSRQVAMQLYIARRSEPHTRHVLQCTMFCQKPHFQLNVTNLPSQWQWLQPGFWFLVCWCKWWHWVFGEEQNLLQWLPKSYLHCLSTTDQVLPTLSEHHWPRVLPTLTTDPSCIYLHCLSTTDIPDFLFALSKHDRCIIWAAKWPPPPFS